MLNKLMHRYGELAGIPEHKGHFHSLKHTRGTMLCDAGVEIRQVQDHMGHVEIGSTLIYAVATENQRQRTSESLERIVL